MNRIISLLSILLAQNLCAQALVNPFNKVTPPNTIPNFVFGIDSLAVGGLADNANISSVPDFYGTGITVSAPGTNPKKQTWNGLPVIRFTSADKLVTSSFLDSSFDNAFTVVTLFRTKSAVLKVIASNGGTTLYIGHNSNRDFQLNTSGLSVALRNTVNRGSGRVCSFRYDGATAKTWIGKSQQSSVACTGNLGLSGALTLGDLSTGGFAFSGDLACLYVFKRSITDTELGQVVDWINSHYPDFGNIGTIACDGNSLTSGVGATHPYTYYLKNLLDAGSNLQTYGYYGYFLFFGVSGQTFAQMESDAATQIDPYIAYPGTSKTDLLIAWETTNDILLGADLTTCQSRAITYCSNRRSAGWKVMFLPCIARGNFSGAQETIRQNFNTWARANWRTFADYFCDVASDSHFDEQTDASDTTYYNADTVHLTDTGYTQIATLIAGAMQAAGLY